MLFRSSGQRWTSARGIVAHVGVIRDEPMLVVGEVWQRGRILGRIGGRFTYDGSVHRLPERR